MKHIPHCLVHKDHVFVNDEFRETEEWYTYIPILEKRVKQAHHREDGPAIIDNINNEVEYDWAISGVYYE